jgi:predicted Fe-S protein YdhL (DUF1289 family)
MGCGRALKEIIAWSTSSEQDKQQILRLCRERQERRERGRNARGRDG